MPNIVVQDDKILRALQVVLDPEVSMERTAALCDYLSFDIPDPMAWIEKQRAKAATIWPPKMHMIADEQAMLPHLTHANAIVTESLKVGVEELALAKDLKLVQKFGTDTRNIDLDACERSGVGVRTLKRRVNGVVAEHAILLMLAVGRKLTETNGALDFTSLAALGYSPRMFDPDHIAGANWARIDGLRSLQGATVGALGLGEVGREVALRANAMGAKILYHQRTRLPKESEQRHGAVYASYDVLLRQSDFISIHLPLNETTEGMVDVRSFALMKPGAILVNISRAHIIERAALIAALDSGRLGGAGLDVHYEEPAAPDEPLKQYRNVVLSPHVAVAQRHHNLADTAELIENLIDALTG